MPKTYGSLQAEIGELTRKIDALQATIDALMLEYCPEDMTPEQFENWKQHQRPSND